MNEQNQVKGKLVVTHTLQKRVQDAYAEKRRLVAPLMGFPGLKAVNSTIKLAQQNYGEHYKVLQALVQRFHPDIIFPLMDLSVEANALGRYTVFPEEDMPTVTPNDFKIEQLHKLKSINIAFDTRLQGYVEMIKLMGLSFPAALFRGAYVTGPYTLAAQIMGSDAAAMATITDPDKLQTLCECTTLVIRDYVRLLVGAGAQIVCILEPSAVMLGPEQFERFSSDFVGIITQDCSSSDVALIYHTCGNTMHLIEKMAGSGVDAVSLDSPKVGVDLKEVAERLNEKTIVIGNINPTGDILNATPDVVAHTVSHLLKEMDPYPNFILSTGCDLPLETPLENIKAFMDTGRNYRIGQR